jgi:mannose-6-phosphate isomerase
VNSQQMPGRFSIERTPKPWGYELLWALTDSYAAKVLHVRGNHSLSLQMHVHKHETMCVLSGLVRLFIEHDGVSTTTELRPGESFHIPAGTVHRLTALVDSDVLEASTPELSDVIRLADDYGRAPVPVVEAPVTFESPVLSPQPA